MKPLLLKSLALLPVVAVSCVEKKQPAVSPNLVFIMADQWRGDALGCLNREPVRTPCLDRLAAEGVVFGNAVSGYPVSSPARGMLMTGMYPVHSGVTGNCNSENTPYGVELPQDARCWSDVLKEKGYQTAYIGKWHLDAPYEPYVDTDNNRGKVAWNEWCPKERRHGFDYWVAYGTYDYHLKPMYWNTDAPRDSFYYVEQWGPEYEVNTAIDYLNNRRQEGQPFALVVSMNPPHTGYELVPEKYKELYSDWDAEAYAASRPDVPPAGTPPGDFFRNNIRNYYACMSGVDEQVGRLVGELKRLGLFENTIVVFTSDHGDNMGMNGLTGKNVCYDNAMRIPMIITWPDRLAPRKDSVTMIAFADLYPTLLSLMGYGKDIPQTVQTFDLSELLLKGEEFSGLEQPYYRLVPSDPTSGYRGLRTDRYTFAVHVTGGKPDEYILYDRTADPYQQQNIAAENPDLVRQLTGRLKDWLEVTDDSFAAYL